MRRWGFSLHFGTPPTPQSVSNALWRPPQFLWAQSLGGGWPPPPDPSSIHLCSVAGWGGPPPPIPSPPRLRSLECSGVGGAVLQGTEMHSVQGGGGGEVPLQLIQAPCFGAARRTANRQSASEPAAIFTASRVETWGNTVPCAVSLERTCRDHASLC